ncbi:MAG: creatininase family protein [Myxococcales bacterium]
MTAAVSLADVTRARVAEIAPAAVLVLAFGATEQHGPHLPFGTDFLVVDAIARRAGDRAAEHVADDGTGRRGTRLDFDDFVGQAGRPGCRVRHFRIGNGARGKREC